MDKYLGLTQQTCSWMLAYPAVLNAFYKTLISGDLDSLKKAEFAAGPLRIAGSPDGRLIVAWNREYLNGTGHEAWGFSLLSGNFGLFSQFNISQQVFERQIYISSQRLQSLIIDGDFIHRTLSNGSQTCLAGRGNEARQFSVCYFEGAPGYMGLLSKAIISIGPGHDFNDLQEAIEPVAREMSSLSMVADEIIETRRRPLIDAPTFQDLRSSLLPAQQAVLQFDNVNLSADFQARQSEISPYETAHWTYDDWISKMSLNEAQRRVLESDVLLKHPVRVIGPAGSGKTLLMQLLALRHLRAAQRAGTNVKVLYIVHNAAMAVNVSDRFRVLGGEEYLTRSDCSLKITTLSDYGRTAVGLSDNMVVDKDASETKNFQLEQVKQSLRDAISAAGEKLNQSPLIRQVSLNEDLFNVFSELVVAEISNAIKGRGLTQDEKRYVGTDTPLSRLHGVMSPTERSIVYDCFKRYHATMFEEWEILDSDDIALSLAGKLRTPLWQLKRKSDGFDFIFVDEAQLFNENERRVFPYLSTGRSTNIPIALALDEAQDLFAFSGAGLATLGITNIENESLPSNHRSTREIVDLAFYIIQQTTDLFTSDFPDFQKIERGMVPSNHPLSAPPAIVFCNAEQPSFGRFVVKQVQKLRTKNVRQIAVVCHAETYWQELLDSSRASGLPLHIIEQRGEKVSPDQPMVILSRPAFIGGQEFDAVISVGLEQGITPPRIVDNVALAAAIEQQTLREMYLVVTRARYQYLALMNNASVPNAILEGALADNLIFNRPV